MTLLPAVLVGLVMEKYEKQKTKQNKKDIKKSRRIDGHELEIEAVITEPRVMLTPVKRHNRASSSSSTTSDDEDCPRPSGKAIKRRHIPDDNVENAENPECSFLEAVSRERKDLERFLFEETNKVNRPAIRFILEKWSAMESRLQSALIENEILKEKCKAVKPQNVIGTYAQAAAMRRHEQRPPGSQEPKRNVTKEKGEVLLIRPSKEDKRSNDQLKTEVFKKLDKVRKTLKVKSVRQMRKQGLVVEVQSNKDVETIKNCDLSKLGLVVERPKKLNPFVMVYDVEKDYKEDELKEDLVRKNSDNIPESEIEEMKESIRFVHSFKCKSGSNLNRIVQVPAKLYANLTSAGRAFLMWKTYRVKEYVNITRCYKCHGYGHIAKVCTAPEQLCSVCGRNDHLRKDCTRKKDPQCINCVRAKRKDAKHEIHDKECPEYRRFLEMYYSRIKWD